MSRPRLREDEHTAWLDLLVDLRDPFVAAPVSRAILGEHLPKMTYADRNALLDHLADTWAPDGTRVPQSGEPAGWYEAEARWMLRDVLGYRDGQTIDWTPDWQTTFSQSGSIVTLKPTAIIHAPDAPDDRHALVFATPGMIIPDDPEDFLKTTRRGETIYDAGALTKQHGWNASVVHRATRAANAAGVPVVLLSNGRFWTVVAVHDDTVGYATFDVTLFKPEAPLRRAFVTLLDARRQFAVGTDETFTAILSESVRKQKAVTDSLGKSVRQSAEVIVASFSSFDQRNTEGDLLRHVPEGQVYEAAVTVIMRLVFLLYAEENGLFPLDKPVYRDNYAASTLRERLADQMRFGSAKAQRSSTGWHRLLALFRAVHDGIDTNGLRIFAYGGSLFDPDRYPFLEGRIVGPDGAEIDAVLPELVDDAALFEIINAISIVAGRPLSFQSLDVEQIGHVYESLLDHSAVRADDVVLGLIGKDGDEPEIDLTTLETQYAKGIKAFAKWFYKESGKATKAKADKVSERLADEPNPDVLRGLLTVSGGDEDIRDRILPFANLLRLDLRRLPMVILPGGFYVTETPMKSDTGTAYTTKELATEIAKHALDPLLYEPGPHDEEDESRWLPRTPDEILSIRFCDPAIGSAAIVVAAVRYTADVLVESRRRAGLISDDQMHAATANRNMLDVNVQAARDIVSRCVYGVDINPMAVEMAKMSLWLITMAKDQPFTFLDHAIKCGNALLGITRLDQLRRVTLAPEPSVDWVTEARNRRLDRAIAADGRQEPLFTTHGEARQDAMFAADERGIYTAGYGEYLTTIDTLIAESRGLRKQIRSAPPKDRSEADHHAKMHAEAQAITEKIRLAADAITAACLSTAHQSATKRDGRLAELPALLGDLDDPNHISALRERVERWKNEHNPNPQMARQFFHWPVEFPEVCEGSVFDAFIGNPPFLGGQKISGPHGKDFREHLVTYIAEGEKGSADLVAYFLLRASSLSSSFGFIATNSVSQGETHDVGLHRLFRSGSLHRAWSSRRWPNSHPAVHVSLLWFTSRSWQTEVVLDGRPWPGITSDLYPMRSVSGSPLALPSHAGAANQGFIPVGSGFHMAEDEARGMLAADPRNADVVRPYAGGEINDHPTQRAKRWTIFFGGMDYDEAATYAAPMERVRTLVKPDRETNNRKSTRERWWRYGEHRPGLLERLENVDHLIAMVAHSSFAVPIRMSSRTVLSNGVVIFPYDDFALYGALTSTIHRVWADRYGSTIGHGLRYTHSSVFDPFPFPEQSEALAAAMQELHDWRAERLVEAHEGLADLYSRYHAPTASDSVVEELRLRHANLDTVLLAAYGWDDIDLQHDHYETRYGTFFTMPDAVRYEVLERLLLLNFEQYADQTGTSMGRVLEMARGEA